MLAVLLPGFPGASVMATTIFCIRHHGPGSARSVVRSLWSLNPDIVLVEGPPEAPDTLSLLAEVDMQPPVALLIYPPDHLKQSAYYPFAVFSPEWQAIKYALEKEIPVRFIDLPQTHQIAERIAKEQPEKTASEEPDLEKLPENEAAHPKGSTAVPIEAIMSDPLGMLAEAAG